MSRRAGMSQDATPLLLDPDEAAFEIANTDGCGIAVLTCDHASNRFPRRLGSLGLDRAAIASHIAWDPGAAWVARRLSRLLDAPLVLSNFSRLVIDCNRPVESPASVPAESAGVVVPGNQRPSDADAAVRRAALFDPYHAAIAAVLDARRRAGRPTALLAIHSFTADYPGETRPWTIGVSCNRDRRLAELLLDVLAEEATLVVGDNRPYSVDDESDYTIPVHGERRGIPHALIEIRQDGLATEAAAAVWADRLARAFRRLEPMLDSGLAGPVSSTEEI